MCIGVNSIDRTKRKRDSSTFELEFFPRKHFSQWGKGKFRFEQDSWGPVMFLQSLKKCSVVFLIPAGMMETHMPLACGQSLYIIG